MGVFTDELSRPNRFAPPWFLNPYMRTLLRGVGGVLDEFRVRVFDGMRSAIPYAGPGGARTDAGAARECDEDVLEWHSRDRGIRLYDSEPLLSKRVRLSRWRQLKKRRGSHLGELQNLQPFWLSQETSVLPWMRIVHQSAAGTPSSVWYTMSPAGVLTINRRTTTNWRFDDQTSKRSRYWLIIHLPPGYSTGVVYDGPARWDGGAIYDGVTAIAIRDIVDAVKEAKAAHTRLAGVIATTLQPTQLVPGGGGALVFDPLSVAATLPDGSTSLPTGNWQYTVDPITNLPTRPPWASFLYEDNV